MSNQTERKLRRPRRSPLLLFVLLLVWSAIVGWGLASLTNAQPTNQSVTDTLAPLNPVIAQVDTVPQRYQLGQQLYLENCATCHLAVPPFVLPTQTWQRVLQDSQHYGTKIKPLVDPPRLLVWNYLRTFSRPLNKEEEIPFRTQDSRFFKALHPKVKLPNPANLSSCISCHPSANEFNFRRLTPEWESQ